VTVLFEELSTPAGNLDRFGSRWRMVGAGLSDVWRYGDLVLDAPSGRLLLRGPNGTGKTTALEALWPFLLDLNRKLMSAGKSRTTNLRSLMREGATGRRRVGYLWMTLAEPETSDEHTFGVRVEFTESAAPTLLPFTVPGRPLRDLALHGPGRTPPTAANFELAVRDAGGQTFDESGYVAHLAARVWGTTSEGLADLATRLRALRNPSALAAMSPREAADALREALPAVDPKVLAQTGDALAESDTTRDAFARDAEAAEALTDFAAAWAGHAVDQVTKAHTRLGSTLDDQSRVDAELARVTGERDTARIRVSQLDTEISEATRGRATASETIAGLKASRAYDEARELDRRQDEARRARKLADQALARAGEDTRRRRSQVGVLRSDLDNLTTALTDLTRGAQELDPATLTPPLPVFRFTDTSPVRVAASDLDPGPDVHLVTNEQELAASVTQWRARVTEHKTRAAAADLALTDHTTRVAPLDAEARAAAAAVVTAAGVLEQVRAGLAVRTATAHAKVAELLAAVRQWAADPTNLTLLTATTGHANVEEWAPHLLDDLAGDEPGLVIAQVDQWTATVDTSAATRAGTLDAQATTARAQASERTTDAAGLRAQAAELRAGQVLPLPRPAWTTQTPDRAATQPADDTLFGSALTWADGVDAPVRDRVESALATAGLLGAQLGVDGLVHPDWVIHTDGPPAPAPTLASVLAPDPDHPLAAAASHVLDRVHLAEDTDDHTHLVAIGTDATFRLGSVRGHAPGSRRGEDAPEASHIGAARRLAAARARADALDAEADVLDAEATSLNRRAAEHHAHANAVTERARNFPATGEAYRAETARSTTAEDEADRSRALRDREATARTARMALADAANAWADRTRDAGLPPEPTQLGGLARELRQLAARLGESAGRLESTVTRTVPQLHARVADLALGVVVTASVAEALERHDVAEVSERTLANLRATAGKAADEVARAIAEAEQQVTDLESRITALSGQRRTAQQAADQADGHLEGLHPALAAAQQAADEAAAALLRLLRAPGVSAVLVGPAAAEAWWEPDLRAAVGGAVDGKHALVTRALTERYDPTRARIGDAWGLHPGDPVDGLLTYELTHRDVVYDPAGAAVHAMALADRARAALNAAEDEALRRFVIGMLPQAIGQAWQGMFDWVAQVNTKMRAAAASSGLKVTVRVPKREDLNPAEQTVVQLACKMSGADRTEAQTEALGQALRSLVDAADGVTMTEKVAAAVDVRQWVHIVYMVDRGNGKEERWGSRTGLSGGERRLVVLAPMLAAVAAGYDALGPAGLRLAALDEVPAEVDERGREGLARFIATLDLDLVATSYLWDGAPGAWDGIEAWDLEAGSDGTVVGFLMSVRGTTSLPGDPPEHP